MPVRKASTESKAGAKDAKPAAKGGKVSKTAKGRAVKGKRETADADT